MELAVRRRWNRNYEPQLWHGSPWALRRYLDSYGIVVSYNEAQEIVRRGSDLRRIIESRATRDEEGRIVSRFRQKLGPEEVAPSAPQQEDTSAPASISFPVKSYGMNGTSYFNDEKSRRVITSGKRKRNVKKMLMNQFVKEGQDTVVARFQSLMPFETVSLRSYHLGVDFQANNNLIVTPIYAFNLSAMPRKLGNPSNWAPCPFYRLLKTQSATGAASTGVTNYSWTVWEKGGYSNNEGEKETDLQLKRIWDMEDEGAPYPCDKYVHNWSDINLMFQAATKYQTSISVKIVSFLNDCGPVRISYKNAEFVTNDTQTLSGEQISSNDVFWDRYLQRKIIHPMAVNAKPDISTRHMVVHSSQNVELPIETNETVDARPITKMVRIFYKNNDVYNTSTTLDEEAYGHKVVYQHSAPGANQTELPPGYTVNANFNDSDTYASPYVINRSADKWLLIEPYNVYHRPAERTVENTASFDMLIRGKYTYLHRNLS